MSRDQPGLRAFKPAMMIIGALYLLLASSMLVRGVAVMRDFAVPESVVAAPVFEDFFLFFYQLMAAVGVLTAVFGQVTRGRNAQVLVAAVFCVLNVLLTLRDVSTSDSSLGNRLYRGSATLIPVYIDLVLTLACGALALAGWRRQS
jgi:Na+/glutamate symporter